MALPQGCDLRRGKGKRMYRVKIYRDNKVVASFLEDIISQAVGRARTIGKHQDHMYIHEVIRTADGGIEEVECVLNAPLLKKEYFKFRA